MLKLVSLPVSDYPLTAYDLKEGDIAECDKEGVVVIKSQGGVWAINKAAWGWSSETLRGGHSGYLTSYKFRKLPKGTTFVVD